jgi:hypothetical protein
LNCAIPTFPVVLSMTILFVPVELLFVPSVRKSILPVVLSMAECCPAIPLLKNNLAD